MWKYRTHGERLNYVKTLLSRHCRMQDGAHNDQLLSKTAAAAEDVESRGSVDESDKTR